MRFVSSDLNTTLQKRKSLWNVLERIQAIRLVVSIVIVDTTTIMGCRMNLLSFYVRIFPFIA